ncbi:MAG TPA: carboxypeptidase-like regulatory domain-containing protein [Terriglobales bacterium]|nr:carboxypeptidase-like regulatory domain-containing protein [Terriglobales bacterium]
MRIRFWIRIVVLLVVLPVLAACLWAQDDEGPTSSLKISVVRDTDGKPVKSAQVVLHPISRKGKSKGEMDLKTDVDGHAAADSIPFGTVELQVIAKGFQTFGQDYEVKQPEMEITIKLKRPAGQYSTYENHDDKAPQKPQ